MVIELTPQTIITAGAVVTATVLLVQRFAKGVRWFDRQEKQTSDIEELKHQHDADVEKLENAMTKAFQAVYDLAQEKELYMRDAAYVISINRVVNAVKVRGWV